MMAYFPLIGIHVVNLLGVGAAFRDSLWKKWRSSEDDNNQRERRRNKEALNEIGQLLKLKNLWLMGGFYLFNCGAWSSAGGLTLLLHGPSHN